MVSLAFQERGVEVTSVGNGEAAVRRLPDLNPDLILADIFMPVRNGYELCEWVKKDSKFSHIPVILLVGAFDPLDEKEARRVGADGVLKKPFIPPDPLIAMVTSTLEKNPRIAAEMAKAKEAAAAPPPPPPTVAVAPRIEVKPLPQFPESAEDDASLAYGFGSGRRGGDDEYSEESAAARAPKSEAENEAQEEFEGSSTTNDWRRSAMEFEVPEEAARKPAFSTEEEIESPHASSGSAAEDSPAPAVEEIDTAIEQDPVDHLPEIPLDLQEQHFGLPEAASVDEHLANRLPLSQAPAEMEDAAPPTVAISGTEEFASADEKDSAKKPMGAPEPSFASKASHWMDLMASTLGKPKGDWLSSLGEQSSARQEGREGEAKPIVSESSPGNEPRQVRGEEQLVSQQGPTDTPMAPAIQLGAQPPSVEPEEWFFADEPPEAEASAIAEAGVQELPKSGPTGVNQEHDWLSESGPSRDEQPAVGFETTIAEDLPVPSVEADSELVEDKAGEQSPVSTDPALITPAAVRVTPEPLLVDESASGHLSYGAQEQEVPPAYSFLPKEEESSHSEPTASHEPFAEGSTPQQPSDSADQREGRLEFSESEFDERVPTSVPANREALAGIPFLNPPPDFHEREDEEEERESVTSSSSGLTTDPVGVDALAQKILDKIEPQLRGLLSENLLKPLIETLVQSELQKKGR